MIVRLKAIKHSPPSTAAVKFQFYDSPIKRIDNFSVMPYHDTLFQFYDSPIKSQTKKYYEIRTPCRFNSMIVRLKVRSIKKNTPQPRFQFYDSPIKSSRIGGISASLTSFNSMIVRLKERI